jgi:hypothetical protein
MPVSLICHNLDLGTLGLPGPAIRRWLVSLNTQEELEFVRRIVVGVLVAARPRFEGNREDRQAYDALCDAVEEWFQVEIAPLWRARLH